MPAPEITARQFFKEDKKTLDAVAKLDMAHLAPTTAALCAIHKSHIDNAFSWMLNHESSLDHSSMNALNTSMGVLQGSYDVINAYADATKEVIPTAFTEQVEYLFDRHEVLREELSMSRVKGPTRELPARSALSWDANVG